MIELELTSPHHVTVGYTGVPGSRTFFLQAQDEDELVTVQLEKTQVQGLGELLGQLLARLGSSPVTDWDRAAMALRTPIEPRWRVGGISLGVDPEEHAFALEVEELLLDDQGTPDDPASPLAEADLAEPRELRLWLDVDLARRLAAHAVEVVGQGRPRCALCGRPTDRDGGHVCPATNGHSAQHR